MSGHPSLGQVRRMTSLSCGLCSAFVEAGALERHLRVELRYFEWQCGLCLVLFTTFEDARHHFAGPRSPHPRLPPTIVESPDAALERRLTELLPPTIVESPDAALERRLTELLPPQEQKPKTVVTRAPFSLLPAAEEEQESTLVDFESTKTELSSDDLASEAGSDSTAEAEPRPESPSAEASPAVPGLDRSRHGLSMSTGLYQCRKCLRQVQKTSFREHVIRFHFSGDNYVCRICDHKAAHRRRVLRHIREAHGTKAQTSDYELAIPQDTLKNAIKYYFGNPSATSYPEYECLQCRCSVQTARARDHVIIYHLKVAVHACSACSHMTAEWSTNAMRRHIRSVHKDADPDAAFTNGRERVRTRVDRVMKEIYK